jgi:hypothetical protein
MEAAIVPFQNILRKQTLTSPTLAPFSLLRHLSSRFALTPQFFNIQLQK